MEPALLNVSTVLASRSAGAEPFGLKDFRRIRLLVSIGSSFFGLGLGLVVLQYVGWANSEPTVGVMFVVASTVIAGCRPLVSSAIGLHQGLAMYRTGALLSTLMSVGVASCVFIVAAVSGQLHLMMLVSAVGHFVVVAVSELRIRVIAPELDAGDSAAGRREILRVLRLNFAATAPSIAFGQADRLVAAIVLGPQAVAVYAIVTSLANQVNTPTSAMSKPLLQELGGTSAGSSARGPLLTSSLGIVALTSSATGLAILAGVRLLRSASPTFAGVTMGLAFAALLIYMLFALAAVGWWTALALGERGSWLPAGFSLVGASITLLGVFFLGQLWGTTGAVVANLGFGVMYVFQLIALRDDLAVVEIVRVQIVPVVALVVGGLGVVLHGGFASWVLLVVLFLAQLMAIMRRFFGQDDSARPPRGKTPPATTAG